MRDVGYDKITDVIYLSGCFMLFRKEYLDEIGYFDENIFMYFEDADITISECILSSRPSLPSLGTRILLLLEISTNQHSSSVNMDGRLFSDPNAK